jgi:uncharacterized membrane protein (UPF0127 family)
VRAPAVALIAATAAAMLVIGAACAGAAPGTSAVIETASGRVVFRAEVADTDELRLRGLMGRTRLAEDEAMAFLWTEDTDAAFHMRDTLIPLSIAFFDADGRILRMLDMDPCAADPCPRYEAGVPYRGALEVNQGALARKGVRVGDRVAIGLRPPL